jgi:hypothetical protein
VSAYSLSGHDTPKRHSQTQDGFAGRLLLSDEEYIQTCVLPPAP